MKKFVLILLIAVLACSHMGYYVIMQHTQYREKRKIQEKLIGELKDEELEKITLADNEGYIYWEEKGKEFLYNGKMYDVVKTKTINGKIILYCLDDKKEKSLIDNYNLVTKHNSSNKKSKSNIDNSINLFLSPDENNVDKHFDLAANKYSPYVSHLTKKISDNSSPPPKPFS